MAKITDTSMTLTDFFGYTVGTQPAKAIEDDKGNVLIFCKNAIIDKINTFLNRCEKDEKERNPVNETMNCDFAKLKTECNKIIDLISNWSDEDLCKVIDCLPRLKNGNIRSTTLPIYMTGITDYEGEPGTWCRISSIELSAVPYTETAPLTNDPRSIFAPDKKIKGVFIIDFTNTREYSKKDIPVIDKDMNYNQVHYERNKYLKPEELVRGKVYADKNDREFLYLGVIKYTGTYHNIRPSDNSPYIIRSSGNGEKVYVFMQMTKKIKKLIDNSDNFKDFMQTFFDNHFKKNKFYQSEGIKKSASFKVVREIDTIFSPDEMLCTIHSGFEKGTLPDEPNAYTNFTFQLLDKKVRCENGTITAYK